MRHRLTGLLPLTSILLLSLAIGALAWYFAPQRRQTGTPVVDPHRNMPPSTRFEGLDLFASHDIRLPAYDGIKAVRIGSLLLRRKKTGFVRLGAFNELVLSDVQLVLDVQQLTPSPGANPPAPDPRSGTVSNSPRLDPEPLRTPAGTMTSVSPSTAVSPPTTAQSLTADLPATMVRVFEAIRSGMLAKDQKISSVRVRNLQILIGKQDGTESCVLRCDEMRPAFTSAHRELQLEGAIALATPGGDTLTCETVIIPLTKTPVLIARRGVIEARGTHRSFSELTIPFEQLITDNGHFLPDRPTAPAASAAGRHTLRSGELTPPNPP